MANHPSAVKRNRQRIRRTQRNRTLKSALRSVLKEARLAAGSGDAKDAAEKALAAKKALARAASKGIIHDNNAARRTARLDHALAKLAG
ncbi:MAG TPA: 30S ribosomal protein S20 [Polyangiaceae bacterium]|jgi:small subunit ribosomal protein S20|nr:30S ribosomal protein S20 [Polyangiaceae bacterium]